ncbi:Hypothetical predicted protein [Pelobates cultripes]|uniref:Uncharacterized protein n=1 Tax=Pelobates cultripes TaxID=61616 RepID=A0AAD1THH5_PELCU|nr:Hypothetical predicted protein [Pelobates cultripes]
MASSDSPIRDNMPPAPQVVPRPTGSTVTDVADQEQMNSEELHSLLDATMTKSVTQAVYSAMGVMSDTLSHSISHALLAAQQASTHIAPNPTEHITGKASGRKATKKARHMDEKASKTLRTDRERPVKDNVVAPQQRATHRAKSVRSWKRAKAQVESSESDSEQEEAWSESDDEDSFNLGTLFPDHSAISMSGNEDEDGVEGFTLLDPQGEPLFDPDSLQHPRSTEWFPLDHVAKYIAARIRKPLDKVARNLICIAPIVDPKIAQFLGKTGWKAKKGLDFALRHCQDKILDVLGPSAKIFDMVETALAGGAPIDPLAIRGWIQRAICLLGNANVALATERRKAILIKIEPKLVALAITEPGPQAKGLLFGDSFVKELGTYVGTFTALDKAQANMKKVFSHRVFGGAGRYRGRLPGRSSRGSYRVSRGPFHPLHSSQFEEDPGRLVDPEAFPMADALMVSLLPSSLTSVTLVGGRLGHFIDAWRMLTSDTWVLQTVVGYAIEFVQTPSPPSTTGH